MLEIPRLSSPACRRRVWQVMPKGGIAKHYLHYDPRNSPQMRALPTTSGTNRRPLRTSGMRVLNGGVCSHARTSLSRQISLICGILQGNLKNWLVVTGRESPRNGGDLPFSFGISLDSEQGIRLSLTGKS